MRKDTEQPSENGKSSWIIERRIKRHEREAEQEQPITAQEAREALDILSDEARGIDNGLPEGVGEYERADILQWAEIALGRYIEQTAQGAAQDREDK